MTFSKEIKAKAKEVWNECCAMKQQICPRLKPWEVIAIALQETRQDSYEEGYKECQSEEL